MTLTCRRRAFALPLVIMLTLVCSVLLAAMLTRHSGQLRTSQRQIDTYNFGHATRGLQEALNTWIASNGNNPIAEALAPDGLAFELVTDSGQTVRTYLQDGQGLALGNLAGLSVENFRTGRDALKRLGELAGDRAAGMVRTDGPLAVSVNSAPAEVLDAMVFAVLGDDSGDGLVDDILSKRTAEGYIDSAGVDKLVADSDVPSEFKARVKAMLSANPMLWRVVVVSEWPGSGRPGINYRAWAITARGAGSSQDREAGIRRSVQIFGWERIEDR